VRRTQSHLGGFRPVIESGVLDEKNNFSRVGDFLGADRIGTGDNARCQVVAIANSFKYYASYNSRCGSTAPASAIPHRDSEGFATTSAGSASCP
jgi:hypothetical protein